MCDGRAIPDADIRGSQCTAPPCRHLDRQQSSGRPQHRPPASIQAEALQQRCREAETEADAARAEAMRAAEQYEEARTGLADHEALKLRHAVCPCFEADLLQGHTWMYQAVTMPRGSSAMDCSLFCCGILWQPLHTAGMHTAYGQHTRHPSYYPQSAAASPS